MTRSCPRGTGNTIVLAPNFLAFLFNSSHSHCDIFKPGYNVDHTLVDSLEIPIIGFSSFPCEEDIHFCLFLELVTQSLNSCAAAVGSRYTAASNGTLLCAIRTRLGVIAERTLHVSNFRSSYRPYSFELGCVYNIICFTSGPGLSEGNLSGSQVS